MLALGGPSASGNPNGYGCACSPPTGRAVLGGRRTRLRIAATWPWAALITTAISRLQALASG
jgi:hypothetical protein